VSSLNDFLVFSHQTGWYQKHLYGHALLFYITKIHSQQIHIFQRSITIHHLGS